ncbi:hypothetical protein ARMGADRAFT_1085436 [Armillaria gallica]|uniref:Uncharacterized protein n=1 Tax=Armillaria gallica TaxID=47427 RepID=A0A2H3CXM8_ARMGA|nr:hypothetical protein ARMGADRAFT_1085436 [Armillaria gallica]
MLCQHEEPLAACADCHSWRHCSCWLSAGDLQEVHDNLLPLAQAAHPFVEMHDCNFMVSDCQIRPLLDVLHEAYEMHTTVLCNLLQAFSSVEGQHDTDAMIKFACEYPIGHRLMIDMGLITDEDGLLQKVFDPQFRHYYPCPLQLHSEKSPEPSFPAFTVVRDKKKKKKRRMSEAAEKAVKHVSEDEQADDDQVESDLIDQLEPSPLHPSMAASSSHRA